MTTNEILRQAREHARRTNQARRSERALQAARMRMVRTLNAMPEDDFYALVQARKGN